MQAFEVLYPDIVQNAEEIFQTGSRVICDPPPTDTDSDFMVYVNENIGDFIAQHMSAWVVGGSAPGTGSSPCSWYSLRDGVFNVIITNDRGRFDRMQLATQVAARLNLLNKADRVMLFQAIVEGHSPAAPPFTEVSEM